MNNAALMNCMVQASYDEAFRMAMTNIECLTLLRSGYYVRLRTLHEWNQEEEPSVIIDRVERSHKRLLDACEKHMSKIPEERMAKGLRGYHVILDMDDGTIRILLGKHRNIAADICRTPTPPMRSGMRRWFLYSVLESPWNFTSDRDMAREIVRQMREEDITIARAIMAHFPRILFETRPELWDKLLLSDPSLFRTVNHHMDIAERTLHHRDPKRTHRTNISDFSHDLLHDRAFMLRVLTMYPRMYRVTGLKHDASFVAELLEQRDAFNKNAHFIKHDGDAFDKNAYWTIVDHAMHLDANMMLERFPAVVQTLLTKRGSSIKFFAKNPSKYRDLFINAIAWNWDTFQHIPHELKTEWSFLSELLDAKMTEVPSSRSSRSSRWCSQAYALLKIALQVNKTKVFQIHSELFLRVISMLSKTIAQANPLYLRSTKQDRSLAQKRAQTLFGYYNDDIRTMTRIVTYVVIHVPKTIRCVSDELKSNETFMLPLLEASPDAYYHVPSIRNSFPLLKWGVGHGFDMRTVFKKWNAETDYIAFHYKTHRHILWEILGTTVCQISSPNAEDTRRIPSEVARHVISFLCAKPHSGFFAFARNELVQVYVEEEGVEEEGVEEGGVEEEGVWVSGKIRKLKHPMYVVQLDPHQKLGGKVTTKVTAYCFDIRRL